MRYEPGDDDTDRALRDHHQSVDRIAAAAGVRPPKFGPPVTRAQVVERQIRGRRAADIATAATVAGLVAVAAAGAAAWWHKRSMDKGGT